MFPQDWECRDSLPVCYRGVRKHTSSPARPFSSFLFVSSSLEHKHRGHTHTRNANVSLMALFFCPAQTRRLLELQLIAETNRNAAGLSFSAKQTGRPDKPVCSACRMSKAFARVIVCVLVCFLAFWGAVHSYPGIGLKPYIFKTTQRKMWKRLYAVYTFIHKYARNEWERCSTYVQPGVAVHVYSLKVDEEEEHLKLAVFKASPRGPRWRPSHSNEVAYTACIPKKTLTFAWLDTKNILVLSLPIMPVDHSIYLANHSHSGECHFETRQDTANQSVVWQHVDFFLLPYLKWPPGNIDWLL